MLANNVVNVALVAAERWFELGKNHGVVLFNFLGNQVAQKSTSAAFQTVQIVFYPLSLMKCSGVQQALFYTLIICTSDCSRLQPIAGATASIIKIWSVNHFTEKLG